MQSLEEHQDWKSLHRPDIQEKPEFGLLLKEFRKGGRRPSVYLIWEREFGKVDKLGIVCICTTRDLAESRCSAMNKNSFWEGHDFRSPKSYLIEEVEVDHLFAAEMMGYDIVADKDYEQMARAELWYPMSDEARIERIKKACQEYTEKIEARITEVEAYLIEAEARAEAAESALRERNNHGRNT